MNIIIKTLFLLILFTSQKIYSQSDKWTYMYDWGGENNNHYSEFYDLKDLIYGDCYIEVWLKTICNGYDEASIQEGSNIKKKVHYYLHKNRYYCGKRIIEKHVDMIYFEDGEFRTLDDKFIINGKVEYLSVEVRPETNLEAEYLFFCFK